MPVSIAIRDAGASLETVGGKGLSLARLTQAGFDVPEGFLVTTAAYRRFAARHRLQPRIVELARPALANGGASFDEAAAAIRLLFAVRAMDDDTRAEIRAAYQALGGADASLAVAVRSSANAEDLPDLSFAGRRRPSSTSARCRVLDAVKA